MITRSAPLTWAQQNIWQQHHHLPPEHRKELTFAIRYNPPPGSTVTNLRQAMDALVRRYESLRTTYGFTAPEAGPDDAPAGPGEPRQWVAAPGHVPTVLHDSATDPGTAAADVLAGAQDRAFDLDREWPVRLVVLSHDGVPSLMVVLGHHIAIDDWSLEAIRTEFAVLHSDLLARRPVRLPAVSHHPVDLAGHESSPAGRDIAEPALAYWQRTLDQAPADQFQSVRKPVAAEPAGTFSAAEPDSCSLTLSSVTALPAVHQLAERHHVWPSLVHTAAYVTALANYTASPAIALLTYVSNRDLPGYGDLKTCLFQPVPIVVDLTDSPAFDEVVRRTAKACGEAMEHSHYPHDEAQALLTAQNVRLATAVNYLSYPDKERGGARTLLAHNAPSPGWSALGDDCYLRVSEWRDCVVTTLYASSEVMTADAAEHLLTGMADLLANSSPS